MVTTVQLEQDPARLQAEQQRKQQQRLQQQYAPYLPLGAQVVSAEYIQHQRITPSGIPASEQERIGGYTQIRFIVPQIQLPIQQNRKEPFIQGVPISVVKKREYIKSQLPKGATDITYRKVPQGDSYTVMFRGPPTKPLTEWEIWFGKQSPSDILSQLALRNLWDPTYKKSLAEKRLSPEQERIASQERTFQLGIGVAVATVVITAADFAYSAYRILQARSAAKDLAKLIAEPSSGMEGPEQFTITRVTGAKGERAFSTERITPIEKPIVEDFAVKPLPRGMWSKKNIWAEEKGSTTIQELFIKPFTTLETTKVPFSGYVPSRFITEMFTLGSVPGLFAQGKRAPSYQWVSQIKPIQPQRLTRQQSFIEQISKPSISQKRDIATFTSVIQEQGQITKQVPIQIQKQAQKQSQIYIQRLLQMPRTATPLFLRRFEGSPDFGFGRKGKGKWFMRVHPIPEPEKVWKLFMMGKQRKGGRRRR